MLHRIVVRARLSGGRLGAGNGPLRASDERIDGEFLRVVPLDHLAVVRAEGVTTHRFGAYVVQPFERAHSDHPTRRIVREMRAM